MPTQPAPVPRIVNIINFVRACEPRLEVDLLAPVLEQMKLLREHGLTGTFLVQHDAVIDAKFSDPMKQAMREGHELGAWLEVVQPMVERAGLRWRGRYPWDWHSDVGFTIGYTPAEREKLIDVLMSDFRRVFGVLPRSVGSWYIDAHSLGYLHERYGIRASCNCKDQIGTDGYTMWGGYWNQAYYPSRVNSFLPAQHAEEQIPVPVFRMLGSDPIYQYDSGLGDAMQGVVSLEPVYEKGGGNPAWVRWFFDVTLREPGLGFAYAQAGQENSFGWPAMGAGLTDQLAYLARERSSGAVRVETLEASAEWFRSRYAVTPATAVVALSDPRARGRKTVWFNSRFFRANLLWEGTDFFIRDIQKFDGRYAERYMNAVTTTPYCEYDALPVLDGFRWSVPSDRAGIRLARPGEAGHPAPIGLVGHPVVTTPTEQTMEVSSRTSDGGGVKIRFSENELWVEMDGDWSLSWHWSAEKPSALTAVEPGRLTYRHGGFDYRVEVTRGAASWSGANGLSIASRAGQVSLRMDA